jgi:hypothetical protein
MISETTIADTLADFDALGRSVESRAADAAGLARIAQGLQRMKLHAEARRESELVYLRWRATGGHLELARNEAARRAGALRMLRREQARREEFCAK